MNEESFYICINCFTDNKIKEIILNNNQIVECSFCNSKNLYGISESTCEIIQNYIDALLVYHWDEIEYVPRYGGKYPSELFKENNMVLDWGNIVGNSKEGDLVDSIFSCNTTGIVEYTPDFPMNFAIKNTIDSNELSAVKSKRGYIDKISQIDKLIEVIKNQSVSDKMTYRYFRARSGCEGHHYEGPIPHTGDALSAPPYQLANPGRANRQYIPFLYLAEDAETAINEIRPTTGDLVSVGEFKLEPSLNIFNIFNHDILNNSTSRLAIESLRSICSLNNLFSRPTGSNGQHIYIDTQMIAERIALRGYDGISFKSSFTGKVNFVVFDQEKARYIDKSAKVVRITSVQVKYIFTEYK